ncbi:MAG TPA: isoprenylcysteine carboxylmethyltransferase family protein, partial [Flavilitoribacter sp.]|nr:isoprenylcysteine carboxylmethyltransferase family protein [Flavilitoribacter sp.]
EGVKSRLTRNFIPPRLYRLAYNVLAAGLILPLAVLYSNVEKERIFEPMTLSTICGWLMLAAGAVIGYLAMRQYDLSEFSGTAQLRQNTGSPVTTLNTRGVNAVVRHPLYLASLLTVWGAFLVLPYDVVLLAAVVTSIYLVIGTLLEEQKLRRAFGEEYEVYRQQVPMLLPRLFD